jgi:hypothetical protein
MKKYVWLNIKTGEFSNSWLDANNSTVKNTKIQNEWKLIEYSCLSDNDFEFYNLMKLVTNLKNVSRETRKDQRNREDKHVKKKPDICTSFNCLKNLKSDYCHGCSHALWIGEGEHNGKSWRWEFSKYFGPLFLKKDGEPLKKQPISENHPAWIVFNKWENKLNGR